MRTKIVALLVLTILMSAQVAHACPAPVDEGIFSGTMNVGKWASDCDNHGNRAIAGPGLGLTPWDLTAPPFPKYAAYMISASGLSTPYGPINVYLCGELAPVGAFGAACSVHSGENGKGQIDYQPLHPTAWLKDVTWPTTVGGAVPVTGIARNDHEASIKGKKAHGGSQFLMVMSMSTSKGSCASKQGSSSSWKSGGATSFTVVAAYLIVP